MGAVVGTEDCCPVEATDEDATGGAPAFAGPAFAGREVAAVVDVAAEDDAAPLVLVRRACRALSHLISSSSEGAQSKKVRLGVMTLKQFSVFFLGPSALMPGPCELAPLPPALLPCPLLAPTPATRFEATPAAAATTLCRRSDLLVSSALEASPLPPPLAPSRALPMELKLNAPPLPPGDVGEEL